MIWQVGAMAERGWVTLGGKHVEALEGYYELRHYADSRMVYERLGTDSAKAWNECKRKELELAARIVARHAGLRVADDAGRLSLAAALVRFVQAAEIAAPRKLPRYTDTPARNSCSW